MTDDRERNEAAFAANQALWEAWTAVHAAGSFYDVDAFRAGEHLSLPALGSPPGLVDEDTVARLWAALARAGKADSVRQALLETVAVRR